MKPTQKELLEEKIKTLIETVEQSGSWKKPFKSVMTNGLPMNYFSNNYYKGANIFFLWMHSLDMGYQTNNYLTLNQCNKLKAKVNKGEKSTLVFFFKPKEISEINSDGEVEVKTIPILKSYRVFNIDQTTLKPKVNLDETSVVETISRCEEFFSSLDLCPIKEGNAPYYAVNSDYISIPNINYFINSNSYYATLAHELIHCTGHKSRLNRNMDNKRKDYAYEELIAELGACFISSYLNIDEDDIQNNAKAYLKSWLKALKDDSKYLYKAFSEASRAFEYILKISETTTEAAA